jgi:hypothetical protein
MAFLTRRKVIFGAVTVMVLGIVSLSYAAWTSSGGGTGFAKAATAQALSSVDVSATTTATLYPGANGDLNLKISNPNQYPISITAVSGNGTITADSSHSTCGSDSSHLTGVSYTNQTGLSISVPASSSQAVTLSGSVHMSNSSDNSCQGATFTVPVSLTGASAATS